MKLLSTIAAVLISISAFSQDYVKYDNGIFTQNGEELSMQQIKDLTVLHKVGKSNVRRGINFDLMYKDVDLRMNNDGLNFIGGAATGFLGVPFVLFGGALIGFEIRTTDLYSLGQGALLLVPGTGLCVVSYRAFSRITISPEGCLRKRDKQFNKVADKINQAIAAGGPLVQSSNQ